MKTSVFAAMIAAGLLAWPAAALSQEPSEPAATEAVEEHADEAHEGEAHGAGGHDLGHGNAGPGLHSMTEVKADLAVYTFIVFLLLLAGLSLTAWPKISKALLEREKRIEAEIAAAAAKHEEAKQLLAQHEAKLASAAAEVRALLEEARRDAEVAKEDIIAEARAAAGLERERAVRDIKVAANEAMKNLAETSANMAVELAAKVIRETINPAKQQELVRHALGKLNASNN
jgi:F-type H+-transporting ATPase subunit b